MKKNVAMFFFIFFISGMQAARFSRVLQLTRQVKGLSQENTVKTRQLIIMASDLKRAQQDLENAHKALLLFQLETQATFHKMEQETKRQLLIQQQQCKQNCSFKK